MELGCTLLDALRRWSPCSSWTFPAALRATLDTSFISWPWCASLSLSPSRGLPYWALLISLLSPRSPFLSRFLHSAVARQIAVYADYVAPSYPEEVEACCEPVYFVP
eukprot:6196064-Pleurochrysis_carterae.AAC.1